MIYLTVLDVLAIYREVMERTGGSVGMRDKGLLDSALAQPQMTFAGEELYPSLAEKAVALSFSLVLNHLL